MLLLLLLLLLATAAPMQSTSMSKSKMKRVGRRAARSKLADFVNRLGEWCGYINAAVYKFTSACNHAGRMNSTAIRSALLFFI